MSSVANEFTELLKVDHARATKLIMAPVISLEGCSIHASEKGSGSSRETQPQAAADRPGRYNKAGQQLRGKSEIARLSMCQGRLVLEHRHRIDQASARV